MSGEVGSGGSGADELLAQRFGDRTVRENLQAAINTGKLIEGEDGRLSLPRARGPRSRWVFVANRGYLPCGFLSKVVFDAAYAQTAVPMGCSACYKIKVKAGTLRELVAAWQLAKAIDCTSKWGVDIDNPHSQDVYAGYYYAGDLDAARALYKVVREAIDADPKLGPGTKMTIKRGCSRFEAAVGPSDSYTFTPEMAEIEAHLRSRFKAAPIAEATNPQEQLSQWIDLAFRMGDDTYLDFTDGKRLRPATMTYEP
ncbi:MAG: hypothetical protein ABI810_20480 [Sphingomonas bacterium]